MSRPDGQDEYRAKAETRGDRVGPTDRAVPSRFLEADRLISRVEHIRLTRIQLAFDPADDPITRHRDGDRTPPLAPAGSLAGSVACVQCNDGDPRTVRMVRLERDSAEVGPLAKSSTQPIRVFLLRTGSGQPVPGIDHHRSLAVLSHSCSFDTRLKVVSGSDRNATGRTYRGLAVAPRLGPRRSGRTRVK